MVRLTEAKAHAEAAHTRRTISTRWLRSNKACVRMMSKAERMLQYALKENNAGIFTCRKCRCHTAECLMSDAKLSTPNETTREDSTLMHSSLEASTHNWKEIGGQSAMTIWKTQENVRDPA